MGEDLRRYQVHQSKEGIPPATMNSSVAALRFFFRVILNHPELGRHLTLVPLPEKLRVVLSQEEVAQLLEAAPGVKYKAAFGVAYGAGLRVSEVAHLKVSDIESKRMLLRIEQGKGKKDRHAMLSPRLLALLRDYWWVAKPRTWAIPGQGTLAPHHDAPASSGRLMGARNDRQFNPVKNCDRVVMPLRCDHQHRHQPDKVRARAITAIGGWKDVSPPAAERRLWIGFWDFAIVVQGLAY
jgi:integrase